MTSRSLLLLALFAPIAASVASAPSRLLTAINEIRVQGCDGRNGVKPALRHDPVLNRVAEAQASGRSLKSAMKDAGYKAVQVAVLEASGSDAARERALSDQGCKDIVNPVYRDVGVALDDGTAWIVLASPLVPPATGDTRDVSRRVLGLVNEARSRSRRCGWKRYDAAPALVLSETLNHAAAVHASDMADRSRLDHTGGDGSSPAERATRAGYAWRVVGENIASGQATPEQVVEEWIGSSHHCANLMSADFTEMGVGFAANSTSSGGIYWAQVFAAPRSQP